MPSLRKLSDRLWCGEISTREAEHHPFAPYDTTEEVARGVAFHKDFVNVTGVRTDDGLVLVDTGSFHPVQHAKSFAGIRSWSSERVHTAIYTHGHVDHAYGLPPFLREAEERGWGRPAVVGHEAVEPRMRRYIETAGYNEVINARQFGVRLDWPTEPLVPTVSFRESLDLRVGDREVRLFHARGETDDHTWVFLPEPRVLCTGDLFIWAAPNAGNPQKVQRYAIDWSRALRTMAALEPEVLLPGHGVPVFGTERVRAALVDTADYLESLYTQTVELLNQGARVYDIVETVKPPVELAEKPYLLPVYDEPEFIVRNVVRHLGGWYSGVPSELKPAPRREQALELVALAGGVERLVARARERGEKRELALACWLIDWASEADPDSAEVQRVRADLYRKQAEVATSTMARGIYGAAARESGERSSKADPTR
jgi:alkyl sulfatase BDS1-like metallo-beta-lactamase superfamily hydrolase